MPQSTESARHFQVSSSDAMPRHREGTEHLAERIIERGFLSAADTPNQRRRQGDAWPASIGEYTVLSEVGRGGMGVVLEARSRNGETVAIKLLRSRGTRIELARFDRETRLQGELVEGDGFVPLLAFGDCALGPFLVMPFLPGGTLADRLTLRGPLTIAATIRLGRALARALACAHARGIVHRDLKPPNVIFTADGEPLIADLGIAKHFDANRTLSASLSQEGAFRGTWGFMPYEQMMNAKGVGPAADVFALGAMLYLCLAGEPAFTGETPYDVGEKVRTGDFERLSARRPETPEWLEAVIHRALARDPKDRFPDGAAFMEALSSPRRRIRSITATGIGLVLSLTIVTAIALVSPKGHRAASEPAGASALTSRPAEPTRAPKPPRLDELVASAKAKLSKADVDGALRDLAAATQLHGRRVDVWCLLGQARWRHGDIDGAIDAYTKAIELDARWAVSWAGRAGARVVKGQYQAALSDAERAVALDPGLAIGWLNRGSARSNLGDLDGGVRDLEEAIRVAPGLALAYANLGITLARRGDRLAAVERLEKAVQLDPGSAEAWAELGATESNLGHVDAAEEHLRRAIKIVPRFGLAWLNLGITLLKRSDPSAALESLSHATDCDAGSHRAWEVRASAELELDLVDAALQSATRAIELEPGSLAAWETRARAFEAKRNVEGARRAYLQLLGLAPGDPRASAWQEKADGLGK
ncbi:tetratricopeptide repeat protein [bacterium]|nr:tetratricopeptide repeat protein [bacterium]